MNYHLDIHLLILIIIMIVIGAFGGFLNYLHSFDLAEDLKEKKRLKYKYILLGIGSSLLVPAFLKMIASDLIKDHSDYDNICYLIFAGFCLIAAIFSRRFITTIGERILEKVEKAEKTSKENKEEIKTTKQELSSTQERIEDVKASVNLGHAASQEVQSEAESPLDSLIILVNSYIERTSLPDYADRLKIKAELGRKMGQMIALHNLNKEELIREHPKEGMYLALAYSIELRPDPNGLLILNKIAKIATQLYTKYVILIAYKTMASSGIISKNEVKGIFNIISDFRSKADKPLLRNIDDTISVLKFIDPEIA